MITAHFSADFSRWNEGLRNAQAALKPLEVSAKGVQQQLARMTSSLSGVEIKKQADVATAAVQAIGGASRLTEAEQRKVNATVTEAIAKYRAMGQEVPEHLKKVQRELQGIEKSTGFLGTTVSKVGALMAGAFTVGALTNLARQALDFAGTMSDLSAKTGIGVKALQEFKFAGGQVGVSLDSITSAVGKLQNNLGEGNKSAVGALRQLGLSFDQLKAMQPEEQFRLVSDRLKDVTDQTEFVQIGMDLMGKGFMEVAPLIRGDLQKLTDDARRLGVVLDEETIAALDDMGDRMDALSSVGMANFARLLVSLEKPLAVFLTAIGSVGAGLESLQGAFTNHIGRILLTVARYHDLEKATLEYVRSLNPLIALLGTLDDEIAKSGQAAADARLQYRLMFEDIRRETVLTAIAAARLQEIRVVPPDAGSVLSSYADDLAAARKAVASLTDEQRRNIRAGLELGESQEDIAKAVGTTSAAVRLYDDALKRSEQAAKKASAEAKKLAADVKAGTAEIAKFHKEVAILNQRVQEQEADKSMKAMVDAFTSMQKMREDTDRELRRLTMSTTAFQIDEVRRWAEAEKRKIAEVGEAYQGHYEDLEAVASAKLAAIVMDTDEWRLAMVQLAGIFPQLFGLLDKLEDKTAGAAKAGAAFGETFRKNLEQSIGNISNIIVDAFVNGASVEDTAAAVAAEIGSAIGASIGFAIGGPMGAAIGDAIGSLLGPLVDVLIKTRAERTVQRVMYEFGVEITEELAQGIEDTAERLFGGNRQAAKIFHLDEIIQEAGGLNSQNFQQLFARFRDLFSMVETGAFTSAQAIEVLDDNFRTFADFVTKGGSLASASLLEIIRLTREAGLASAEVGEFVNQQLGRAFQGLGAVSRGFFNSLDGDFENVGLRIVELADKESMLAAQIADLQKKDQLTEKQKVQLDQWRRQLSGVQDDLRMLREEQARNAAASEKLVAGSQEQFDRIGRIALATFNAAMASGQSLVDVIRQMDPALTALQDSLVFGLEASAPIDDLLGLSQFVEQNEDVINSIAGLNDVMSGLHNSAFLTQEVFTDLGLEAARQFETLQARGLDANAALKVMAPTLQTLWELQEDFGYAVDEATQLLLDEAEAAGVVGEAHRTAQEQMLRLMERQTDALEYMAQLFGYELPNAVDGFANALGALPDDVTVNGRFNWDVPEMPDLPDGPQNTGETYSPGGTRGYATGTPGLGFVDFGRRTTVDLHGREAVVPEHRKTEAAAKWGGGTGGAVYQFAPGSIVVQSYDPKTAGAFVAEALALVADSRSPEAVRVAVKLDQVRRLAR